MGQKLFSVHIRTTADMIALENVVTVLLGGEQHKCALIRSQGFQALRLHALYVKKGELPSAVYGEGLKICLDSNNVGAVYLLDDVVILEDAELAAGLGKRRLDELDED